jgi:hypothetical protein
MQDLIDGFDLINYKTTYDNHEGYGWPYSPWQTHIWYILSIKVMSCGDYYLVFLIVIVYIFVQIN